MKSLKKLAAMLLALSMIFALCACGGEEQDSQQTPDGQQNESQTQTDDGGSQQGDDEGSKGQIVFGTSADYAPMEFHTMINGEDTIVGADIELAKKIAEDMGMELIIKDISFDILLAELQNGSIDFAIASMAATEDRLAQADASDPYFQKDYQRLVIRAEDAEKYTSFDDFSGAKVAVQSGSIQIDLATDNLTGCELLVLQGVPEMANTLINGKCDAMLVDGTVAEGYVESNDGLVMVDKDFPPVPGACVWVQKGDPKGLMDSINATVADVVKDNSFEKWEAEATELAGKD